MEIGIIGLPQSGKTSVFNVLTGGTVETLPSFGNVEPNVAMVKVPDPRLNALASIFKPKKVTQATIRLVDVAGISADVNNDKSPKGLPEQLVRALATTDALLAVVRAFEGQGGTAPDPRGDIETINLELLISDLQKVENRLERLEKFLRRPNSPEREKLLMEQDALLRARAVLEDNKPLRTIEFTPEEQKILRGYLFLSQKPVLYLFNISEEILLEQSQGITPAEWQKFEADNARVGVLCAKVEAEIAALSVEEQQEFLGDFGITEAASEKIIRECYCILGLVSFLTAGEPEVRAWPIVRGSSAPEAGGVIHGDIQKGFVRAEVVKFTDLVSCGSFAEARRRGCLRTEGKSYIVEDDDVIHFLHAK